MRMSKTTLFFIALLLAFSTSIFGQTGGDFTITQSVVASGGQISTGGVFTVGGTIGQPIAETAPASGGAFNLRSGFWIAQLAPTAAGASISGRVRVAGASGKGVRNAQLVLTNVMTGEIRQTRSGFFGAYQFDDLPVGQTYILSISARRFAFAEDTRVVTLLEELTDVDFVGDEIFNY